MSSIRGLPSIKSLMALIAGAAMVPCALWLAADVGVVTACIYGSLAVAVPIAASVIWAYTQLAANAVAERFG